MKISDKERLYVDERTDIANLFNQYFASIFTMDKVGSSEQKDTCRDDAHTINNVTLMDEEIVAVINNLHSSKAQGPDGIPVCLLKEKAMQSFQVCKPSFFIYLFI